METTKLIPNFSRMKLASDYGLLGLTSALTKTRHICKVCWMWALLHLLYLQKLPFWL